MSDTRVAIAGHTRKHPSKDTAGSIIKRPMIGPNTQRPNNIPHNLVHDAIRRGCGTILIFPSHDGSLHVYFQGNVVSQVDLIPSEKADDFVTELLTLFQNRVSVLGKVRASISIKERELPEKLSNLLFWKFPKNTRWSFSF